ncbi:unnamed protein product [Ambrosiozyma monospora]|uniref:Unnamed protein product n=1 Tax=Ambrosiozyma monospora TaxID=43982 RepID=A0ACB5TT91_AMBMO|nr:unnamed protein product [Ambrosiozyma monospora]
MQLSLVSATLAVLSAVANAATPTPDMENVVPALLYVNSTDSELSGNAIYSIHEGAGINYLFLAESGNPELLLSDGTQLFTNATGNIQYFNVDSKFAQLAGETPNSKKYR